MVFQQIIQNDHRSVAFAMYSLITASIVRKLLLFVKFEENFVRWPWLE